MFKTIKYTLPPLILIASFIITACTAESTPTPAQESGIQTAVALTVAAQNAQPSAAPTAIVTPTSPQFSPTLTALAPVASPTKSSSGTTISECASAFLVSETIPDGTIYTPGQQFTKTWEIRNTSTCTWDTSYKIVFWDGDILGGAYVYNLPQVTPPQGVVPISLVLTAPKSDATYKSEWMIQTPDDTAFGVGEYSNVPFYAEIEVSSSASPNYTVTSVTYSVVRDPATGCPANVNYIVSATITTNGPLEFSYIWLQQDGNSGENKGGPGKGIIKMTDAGTKTITREWKLHLGSAPGSQRWIALAVTTPDEQYIEFFPGQYFTYLCGS